MPTPAVTAVTLTIRPRARTWAALQAQTGIDSDAALAALLGVTENTVRRVLHGETDPSPKFIAHSLHAFPFAGFRELFTVCAAK